MTENVALITTLLSLATLIADVALVLVAILYLLGKGPQGYLPATLIRPILLWGSLVALASVVLSLYYSEVVGFEACALCWWQRIFIYPQAILFFIAWRRSEYSIWRYTLPLSIFGLFFGFAHWILQTFHFSIIPCTAAGVSPCEKVFFLEFGYVTFPVMAITTLLILCVISLVSRSLERGA